jgi:hypothetical protein
MISTSIVTAKTNKKKDLQYETPKLHFKNYHGVTCG